MGAIETSDVMPEHEGRQIAASARKRSILLAHLACLGTQSFFGVGGVLAVQFSLKEGVRPVIFALIREGIAGPLLCILARHHIWRFALTGSCLYANQLLFILGAKASDGVYAAIWQPVFTAMIAMAMCLERPAVPKLLGILFATAGAICMLGIGDGTRANVPATLLLVGNCVGMAFYIISMKPLLRHYPPLTVTAWSYIVASVEMAATSLIYAHDASAWTIPLASWAALAYWIVFSSVLAYSFMTYANQYLDASTVNSYTTAQPVAATLIKLFFFGTTPRLRDLGALGIVAGLLLTVWSDRVAGALGLPDIACRPVRLEGDEALLLAAGSSLSAGAPTDGAGDKA